MEVQDKPGSLLSDCCICVEIQCGMMPEEFVIATGMQNRIFMQSRHFLAMPSVSPLNTGHILLLPKEHVSSYAQLSATSLSEFQQFKSEAKGRVTRVFGPVFCWEHGVGCGKQGGCGITHAHLHIVPISTRIQNLLAGFLLERYPQADLVDGLESLAKVATPFDTYLYWETTKASASLVITEDIPSQLVRKLTATLCGDPDWDWRQMSNWDAFKATIRTCGLEQ